MGAASAAEAVAVDADELDAPTGIADRGVAADEAIAARASDRAPELRPALLVADGVDAVVVLDRLLGAVARVQLHAKAGAAATGTAPPNTVAASAATRYFFTG